MPVAARQVRLKFAEAWVPGRNPDPNPRLIASRGSNTASCVNWVIIQNILKIATLAGRLWQPSSIRRWVMLAIETIS